MPVALNDDLWLNIWRQVEPTPPQMGVLRGISKQMCRVLDTDVLWRHFSPQESCGELPLRDAFMVRVGRRSLRGNQRLAEAYNPVGGQPGYDYVRPYLLIGPYGRDDDYDAAQSRYGGSRDWQDYSQVLRNDAAIATRAVHYNGLVLAYVGTHLRTPQRIEMALKSNWRVLNELSPKDRDRDDYAKMACIQDEYAINCASVRLRADEDFCGWYLKRYPNNFDLIATGLRNEMSFFDPELVQRLSGIHRLWDALGEDLRENGLFLAEFFGVTPLYADAGLEGSYEPYDDAVLVQRMWLQTQKKNMFLDYLSDRLKRQWQFIESPLFLSETSSIASNSGLEDVSDAASDGDSDSDASAPHSPLAHSPAGGSRESITSARTFMEDILAEAPDTSPRPTRLSKARALWRRARQSISREVGS